MKRIQRIGRLVFAIMLVSLMLPLNFTFADSAVKMAVAATLESTVYEVNSIGDIVKAIQNDSKAAEENFTSLKIAITGEIKEIREDKHALFLNSGEEKPVIKIDCKNLKEQLKLLSAGESIWLVGEVTKAKKEEFIVKAKQIGETDFQWTNMHAGYADANGTLYPSEKLGTVSLPGISFTTLKKWKSVELERLGDYQLRKDVEKAVCYDLGDGETVTVYSLDWQKLLRATKEHSNSIPDRFHRYEERVSDYVSYNLNLGVVHYENTGDKTGDEKTNTLSFKYYIGSVKKDDSINGEAFFSKVAERFIVVYYKHGDNAKHAQETAFFLGGIKQT